MPYNFVADSFHTKKKIVADFLQAKCDFRRKSAVLRVWAPFGSLGATYTMIILASLESTYIGLILVLIKLHFARCYGLGATSDYWFKLGDFAPTGAAWPKISSIGVAPTNHSFSQ